MKTDINMQLKIALREKLNDGFSDNCIIDHAISECYLFGLKLPQLESKHDSQIELFYFFFFCQLEITYYKALIFYIFID